MANRRELHGDRMTRPDKERHRSVKASVLLMQLREDVKAMNSAISILSQKMRHLTRNEKILGRNLIVLNKKLKELSEGEGEQELPSSVEKNFEEFRKKSQEIDKKIEDLNIVLSNLNRKFVSSEELKELRYIIDSINPMELATVSQVKEIVKKELEKQKSSNEGQIDLG